MNIEKLLPPPTGYPYVLFVSQAEKPNFFLALGEREAKLRFPLQSSSKVDVQDLIKTFGHKETHHFLKKFGSTWVCRMGKIYYRGNVNESASTNQRHLQR